MDLSVIIPTKNEAENIGTAVREAAGTCRDLGIAFEIIVVDAGSRDETASLAAKAGAEVLRQEEPGYGGAILMGFRAARGKYVLTMDADLSHPPAFIRTLWNARESADFIIASRFVPGGHADMPLPRLLLSRVLNSFFRLGLSVPVRDLSSGFRLYRKEILDSAAFSGTDFNVLQNLLVRLYCAGFSVREVPFYYRPRKAGASNARVLAFGISYLKTFRRLRAERFGPEAADFEFRSFQSANPFRRYWLRKRLSHVSNFLSGCRRVLDVGAGSSVLAAVYPNLTAVDRSAAKLRFLARYNPSTVCADARHLPFEDGSFDAVVCSRLVEKEEDDEILSECVRVLRPGGRIVIATPDYSNWQWSLAGLRQGAQPFAPAVEESAKTRRLRYTFGALKRDLAELGCEYSDHRHIFGAELVMAATKRKSGEK